MKVICYFLVSLIIIYILFSLFTELNFTQSLPASTRVEIPGFPVLVNYDITRMQRIAYGQIVIFSFLFIILFSSLIYTFERLYQFRLVPNQQPKYILKIIERLQQANQWCRQKIKRFERFLIVLVFLLVAIPQLPDREAFLALILVISAVYGLSRSPWIYCTLLVLEFFVLLAKFDGFEYFYFE